MRKEKYEMTQEEEEIRERLGIKDEDILQIPASALWELCRQFNDFANTEPYPTHLGDCFFRFYCQRIKEIVKRKAKLTGTDGGKSIKKRPSYFLPGF